MTHARDRSRRTPGQPSQRQLRVGELVRHAVAQALERGDVHDPEIAGKSITVTEVRMSPDLKVATAYVMPLGGEDGATIVEALHRVAPFLRRRIGGDLALKFLPELRFVVDATFDHASRIDRLLREARGETDGEHDGDDGA
jgi:ribosome-binding factor A